VKDQLEGLVNQMWSAGYCLTKRSANSKSRFIKRVLDRANGNQIPRGRNSRYSPQYLLSRKIDEYKLDLNGHRRLSR